MKTIAPVCPNVGATPFFPELNWAKLVNPGAAVLFAASFLLIRKFKKHPIWYIAGGAIAGILIAP